LTALAVTSVEPAGSNCPDGGLKIEVGVDDNGNGSLEANEVDHTQYICNGADGQNGANGANGTDGSASPNTMLTSISPPAASLGCTAGGWVINQGLDNGDGGGTAQNGVLESGEIDYATTYCSTYEVWQVDEIRPSGGNYGYSNPGSAMTILVGDTLYFDAIGTSGTELWAHDTGNSSTWQVADINSGSGCPGCQGMEILVGDTLYFSANDGSSGIELWAHDTSNHSTWQVADINSGDSSRPGYHMVMLIGDTLYFDADDGSSGKELWAHDTGNSSTWQVAEINSGGSSAPGYYMEILVGDTLYFDADDGTTTGAIELWAHDTSNSSTWQVVDISAWGSSYPGYYMEILVGDTIYFGANDMWDGHELWAHDTSNSSTWQVADINGISFGDSFPGQYMATLVGDTLYFSANTSSGRELWAHDTSNSSTWQVADIGNGAVSGSPGFYSTEILVGDTLYFDARGVNGGQELWAHDTGNSSTWQVAEINSGGDSRPGYRMLKLIGDTLYFDADDGSSDRELWAHDTGNSSTWQVTDINSWGSSSPGYYGMDILVGDTLYFSASDGNSGCELWAMMIEHSITYD
jgi:ELWxxDGT repeat protein